MSDFDVFRKAVSVLRQSGGEYVNGVWQPGIETLIVIQASVQPTNGEDMELLPEGRNSRKSYKLYTDTLLRTVGVKNDTGIEANNDNPDVVIIPNFQTEEDERFEVVEVSPRQSGIINHYRVLVVKEKG
jgi:hypothetical protein